MHISSQHEMRAFVDQYLDADEPLKILDVGSMNVNGTYRNLFNVPNWTYVGADRTAGDNVDIVVSPYMFGKPGGVCCIITPWKQREHKYPIDCWRIMPDGMRFLLSEVAGMEVVKTYLNNGRSMHMAPADCVGIAQKV